MSIFDTDWDLVEKMICKDNSDFTDIQESNWNPIIVSRKFWEHNERIWF